MVFTSSSCFCRSASIIRWYIFIFYCFIIIFFSLFIESSNFVFVFFVFSVISCTQPEAFSWEDRRESGISERCFFTSHTLSNTQRTFKGTERRFYQWYDSVSTLSFSHKQRDASAGNRSTADTRGHALAPETEMVSLDPYIVHGTSR